NKSQGARERALSRFKQSELRVLVATDIAARGIDIDWLSYVINYDLPNVPEFYVHRIGRTGRAGSSGRALSFCEAEERPYLRNIERLIGKRVAAVVEHPFASPIGLPKPTDLEARPSGAPAASAHASTAAHRHTQRAHAAPGGRSQRRRRFRPRAQ